MTCKSIAPHGPWQVRPETVRVLDAPFRPRVAHEKQRALGSSALAWARYLNAFHALVHPVFADEYLDGLCAREPNDPLNDGRLFTRVEIAFARDGAIEQVGVVKGSGNRDFDLAVLESVLRVGRAKPPEPTLLSYDGRAYVHWEFFRDEVFACSTMNSRPFLLVSGAESTDISL